MLNLKKKFSLDYKCSAYFNNYGFNPGLNLIYDLSEISCDIWPRSSRDIDEKS